jgi:hypothetical protein
MKGQRSEIGDVLIERGDNTPGVLDAFVGNLLTTRGASAALGIADLAVATRSGSAVPRSRRKSGASGAYAATCVQGTVQARGAPVALTMVAAWLTDITMFRSIRSPDEVPRRSK